MGKSLKNTDKLPPLYQATYWLLLMVLIASFLLWNGTVGTAVITYAFILYLPAVVVATTIFLNLDKLRTEKSAFSKAVYILLIAYVILTILPYSLFYMVCG
jgi:hypothetical protein